MKFNEQQQRTLRAAVDRIIPLDDYPGAWAAGAGDYLAKQFERDLVSVIDVYREGLNSLEAEADLRYQRAFEALTDDDKDFLLSQVEEGEVLAPWPVPPQSFFKLLVETTVEGYYSDPEQGGNRDGVSWLMTGFETV
jgi:hypothetical protein